MITTYLRLDFLNKNSDLINQTRIDERTKSKIRSSNR